MSVRMGHGLLDPVLDYQLTVRQHLDAFGRAMALGRAVTWATRGVCAGLLADVVLLGLHWLRLAEGAAPSALLLASAPLGLALGAALVAATRPRDHRWLARRVDERLGLAERALTAVTGPGDARQAGPLHLWQLRDAVEHLERADPLRSFPVPLPRREGLAALALAAAAAALLALPSPIPTRGLLDARGQLVRDEAERLSRVAQSLAEDPALQSRELEQVRELLRQAARTLEQRISEPERAAESLEELERQLQAMANADQELATALATIASALAASPETRDLGLAFQSGDLRDVSRAARDLARQAEGMGSNARSRAGRALRMAAQQAGNDALGVGQRLAQAADALDPEGAGGEGMQGLSDREALARAQSALRELAEQSAGAAARQRALAAMEGARNALNRGQSGARQPGQGSFGRESARRGGQGEAEGQSGRGESDRNEGEGEQEGSSYGTGTLNRQGEPSRIDALTRPEQVRSGQGALPDEIADAPLLQAPGANPSQLGDEAVAPQFAAQPATDPSLDASIPLGLRELVKEYFSSQEPQR